MKRFFHEELEAVRSHLMEMGERAVESANLALRALEQRDLDIADSVIEGDDMIDAIETRIDEEVARYISLRAPVAKDLRLLPAVAGAMPARTPTVSCTSLGAMASWSAAARARSRWAGRRAAAATGGCSSPTRERRHTPALVAL